MAIIIVGIGILFFIGIIALSVYFDKKSQKAKNALLLQLQNQHGKEFVFFCYSADFDGDIEFLMMGGQANNTITPNTKVIDFEGREHSIREIFVDGKNNDAPVSQALAGEEVMLIVSSGQWKGIKGWQSTPGYSPEFRKLKQKIKDEKVVVLNLK